MCVECGALARIGPSLPLLQNSGGTILVSTEEEGRPLCEILPAKGHSGGEELGRSPPGPCLGFPV